MRVVAIGSGSSGNVTLVIAGSVAVIVDAGLPTKTVERSLHQFGVSPADLAAIFLTHEHSDHIAAAGILSRRYNIPVFASEPTLEAARLGKIHARSLPVSNSICIGDDLLVSSFPLSHDSVEPVGYFLEHKASRVCVATDLGDSSPELHERIRASNLVILEANHDKNSLLRGPYPLALKSRIGGGQGHLSNEQAATCMLAGASGRPQWLWLAHLSAINNSPRMAMRTVSAALRSAGVDTVQVGVALRDRPSVQWDSDNCFVQAKMQFLPGLHW